ncbi:dolichol kinase EVAN [Cinnamomum micranthum f. kanehirae]|uniref:dolichol kinase n=1 Tax=Cinnamomum micranthum f. kanehirae TaxID=337451 RepID=A0A443NLL4_9MAGN|nr:dolichol kinase EVAN [Cinnamomum micranthum f. kanehirae]
MAWSLLNGERVVVILYISRVFFSIPSSLFHESIALFLLALAGLFVEISVENPNSNVLDRFKTRPGASSGILLGTVTLPTVMMSRLIQLSRALSDQDIKLEEFGYLNMQYWAASVSCFSVLIFHWAVPRYFVNNSSDLLHSGSGHDTKFTLVHVVLYAVVCFMSVSSKSYGGLYLAVKLLWILFHGLASVRLVQHILLTFPSCASIGEALLAAGGIILYFGDMLTFTLVKISAHVLFSTSPVHLGMKRSEIGTILQGVLLGLLLLPLFYKFVLQIWIHFLRLINSEARVAEGRTFDGIGKSIVFYASLAVILILIVPEWMQLVQEFYMHPVLWVSTFVFSEPLKRLPLCMYWIGLICVSVFRFYNISKNSRIERILLRKFYHLVAVLMFLPAVYLQPEFLDLAFGAAFAIFLALEMIRVWKIWPLGHLVHQFMNAFTDHRDSDILIISHFSLLLGCALPKWMSTGFNDRPLAPSAGILSLGIGDTMASMVGHKYGVFRWSKTGKKTVEGTAAGITSVLAACSLLLLLLASSGFIFSQHWSSLLFAVTLSGLLEAFTMQLDNAFIPLVFYSLLCL